MEVTTDKGPVYGVELIGTLPMDCRKGSMLQAMPSAEDLEGLLGSKLRCGTRIVAGYEILLNHWREQADEIERLRATVLAMNDSVYDTFAALLGPDCWEDTSREFGKAVAIATKEYRKLSPGMRDHYVGCGKVACDALRLDDDSNSPLEVREKIERLRASVSDLPHKDDIETAMRANMMGVEEFDETNCRCDASVGQYCEGCAIDSVLRRMRRIAIERKETT